MTGTKKNQIAILVGLIFLLVFPPSANALCLKDCDRLKTIQPLQSSDRFQNSYNRQRSHNMGNVKNSIIGDVHIQNGHERLEIKGIESREATIDASINSTVILGDMKQ